MAGGLYGAADRRMSYWNEAASADYIHALKEIVVVLMIEKRQAVEQLDEILAVPGIDMIQWGPADYAMSIGRPGGWHRPGRPRGRARRADPGARGRHPAAGRDQRPGGGAALS